MAMATIPSSTTPAPSSLPFTPKHPTHLLPRLGLRLSAPPSLSLLAPLPPRHTPLPPPILAVSLPILTFEGLPAGEAQLNLKSAVPATARAVVHRGVISELQNRRRGTASTLTRGEVRGGGKKPYKQKKTGRARRGSQRTPLRPGGGVIFGPKPKDWSIKINKKEKQLAISTALQRAAGSVIVVEDFEEKLEVPRTKDFITAMKRWGVDPSERSLLFTTNATENLLLSSRNIGSLKLITPRSLNLYDVLKAHKLIVTKSAVDYLNKQYGLKSYEPEGSESAAAAETV